jgi:hypothetical protein
MKARAGFVCFLLILASAAAASERGTTAADFLKIGLGAGPIGLGEACTARSGDVNQIYYNPAGLEGVEMNMLTATHLEWIAATQYESLAVARPIVGVGTVAAALSLLHMPDIPAMDDSGLEAGSLRAYDLGVQFSLARDLSTWTGASGLTGGASVKVLRRELADVSATGAAVDLGGLYRMGFFTFGLACQNLGYLSGFGDGSENLPITLRAGVACGLAISQDHQLTMLLDLIQPLDNAFHSNVGIEYSFQKTVFVRAGYKLGYDSDGLQVGAGVVLWHIGFDYALKTMGLFGLTHYVTASFGFGDSVQDIKTLRVNENLRQAEGLYSQSKYEESLKIVETAVEVDPTNERALQLKEKLRTVLDMLKMPGNPGESAPAPAAGPKTPDQMEEQVPKEAQP